MKILVQESFFSLPLPLYKTTIIMRKLFLLLFITFLFGVQDISAQHNLAGRVYYNANIMADELNKSFKDLDKDIAKTRAEAIAKGEKKLGRKLNQQELAELDSKLKESREMMNAMKKGMKMSLTLTFKNDKDVVMSADMKVDDDVLKAAGIGWAKRKMIKLATAVMPAQKGKYKVQGNTLYVDDGSKEKDTMLISADGKQLYGKMDGRKFTLNRTK